MSQYIAGEELAAAMMSATRRAICAWEIEVGAICSSGW